MLSVEDIFCSLLAQTFGYRERDLYTHSPLEFAHGEWQLQFCTRRENTFSEFGPSKGERAHRYCAYCNSVKSLLIYVVFQKWRSFIYATSASSFDKNNYQKLHAISWSAIIFQAENATPLFYVFMYLRWWLREHLHLCVGPNIVQATWLLLHSSTSLVRNTSTMSLTQITEQNWF